MRVRRAVVRVELPGCDPARARALAAAALARAAGAPRRDPADPADPADPGRITRLRVRVETPDGGDRAVAGRIARAIAAAIAARAGR